MADIVNKALFALRRNIELGVCKENWKFCNHCFFGFCNLVRN